MIHNGMILKQSCVINDFYGPKWTELDQIGQKNIDDTTLNLHYDYFFLIANNACFIKTLGILMIAKEFAGK